MNENPSYFNLERLDADNNQIESLLDLEGTNFVQIFHILQLRKNRLKSVRVIHPLKFNTRSRRFQKYLVFFSYDSFQIPYYLLSYSLDRNPEGRLLYLEGNSLNCDCNSAKILKVKKNFSFTEIGLCKKC